MTGADAHVERDLAECCAAVLPREKHCAVNCAFHKCKNRNIRPQYVDCREVLTGVFPLSHCCHCDGPLDPPNACEEMGIIAGIVLIGPVQCRLLASRSRKYAEYNGSRVGIIVIADESQSLINAAVSFRKEGIENE